MSLPPEFDSGFTRNSTAEDVTAGVDLSGQTILITGVGSGLGKEALRVLSLRGAHVIGIDRTLEAAQAACDDIPGETTAMACDLSDPKSIVACAEAVRGQFKSLDVLLANAGIMCPPLSVVDHYSQPLEIQFAVNFLGHFVLVNQLMPLLKAAPKARIALVASDGYATAPKKEGIDFDNLDSAKGYDALTAYGHSKLAVLLMKNILAKRLEGSTITASAIHPGVIRTNLASDTKSFKVKMISLFAGPWTRTIAQGAATHCFVAAHPSLDGVNGLYFADSNPKDPTAHPRAKDMELGEALWDKAKTLAEGYLLSDNLIA